MANQNITTTSVVNCLYRHTCIFDVVDLCKRKHLLLFRLGRCIQTHINSTKGTKCLESSLCNLLNTVGSIVRSTIHNGWCAHKNCLFLDLQV